MEADARMGGVIPMGIVVVSLVMSLISDVVLKK